MLLLVARIVLAALGALVLATTAHWLSTLWKMRNSGIPKLRGHYPIIGHLVQILRNRNRVPVWWDYEFQQLPPGQPRW